MGLRSWAKGKVASYVASKTGEDVSKGRYGVRLMNFLKSHKGEIGSVFLAVWAYAWYNNCPPLPFIGDVINNYVSCQSLKDGLGLLGSFLVGGGWLKSDSFHRK